MSKLRILYTIDCGLNAGGAPRSTSILASEMAKEHEVYMLMPYTGEKGNPAIHYIQLKSFKKSFPFIFTQPIQKICFIKQVYKILKEVSPDIIHAEMPRGARALGVLKKMGLIKAPLIYTEREYVTGVRKIYQWLYSILVARPFDLIICLSEKSRPFWMQYRNGGVVSIPNPGGKEYDLYSEDAKRRSVEQLSDCNPNNLNVVFVGRYLNTKRWDLAEAIINDYNRENKNGKVHFYVAVAYEESDNEAKSMVERLSNQYNVTVFSNADVQTMNKLFYACDLHLITSSIESFGRTAIEAMSRKCVVYSTNAGAISETIGDPTLILPAKASCFVKVIEKYDRYRQQLDELKEKLYQRYQLLYTTEANYKANYTEYIKLLNK